MPVAFQNSTTATVNAAATGVINVPSGVANGDMLILGVVIGESVGVVPTVPGWTQKAAVNGSTTQDNCTTLFYRRASSEPASYTVTLDATYGDNAAISMLRYTGVISSGDPFRTSATVSRVASLGSPQTSAALTGVQASDMAIHLGGAVLTTWNSADYNMAGPGGSWVERGEIVAIATDSIPGVLFVEQLGTGTAPVLSATGTGAANTAWCFCAGALMEEPTTSLGGPKIYTTAVRRASIW